VYHFMALPGKERIADLDFKERIDSLVINAGTVLSIGWREDAGMDMFIWLLEHGKRLILVEVWPDNFFTFNESENSNAAIVIRGDIETVEPLLSDQALECVHWSSGPEHMEMSRSKALIRRMQARAKSIIISTPNGEYKQDALYGNHWEEHVSTWTTEDYRELGFSFAPYEGGEGDTLIGYWTKEG